MAEEQKTLGQVAWEAMLAHRKPHEPFDSNGLGWHHLLDEQRERQEVGAQAVKAAVLEESAPRGAHSGAHRQKMVEHGVRECREAQADLQRALVYLAAAMSGPPEEAPGD